MINSQAKKTQNLCVAALRATAIDGINLANSGHPGASLSLAPIMYILYRDFVIANPFKPNWINRDRVVLSCGHASMLLYTILHLCGYNISIDDLKKFRKLGSITPGHPEVGVTEGVDASSGPLGQGIAEAVGIAVAEKMLAAQYSKHLFNHYTYCICGDGCLEEGISQEAISFAGLNKLNKLILLYDANDVTLDGPLAQSDVNDVKKRFESARWNVINVKDGNNLKEIHAALEKAKKEEERPTLIVFKTIIGYGSKNEGTCKVHGAPLGEEDGKNAKLKYGYTNEPFDIPQEVYNDFKETFIARANEKYEKYNNYYQQQKTINAEKINLLEKVINNDLNDLIDNLKFDINSFKESDATRNSSGILLNYFHENLPFLVGGSADVASSVKTHLNNGVNFTPSTPNGTNINWGIREFLMCAASNGILLHGGLRSYVGSFFVFSDYAKSAFRMASLMKVPQIFLLSHDSIAVGEDGPTHQPIEQFAMLRSIPNFNLIRPCDAKETYGAYRVALKSKTTPTAIVLSRQNLPLIPTSLYDGDFEKGAYIIDKATKNIPDGTIIATGSEVSLAIEVKKELLKKGIDLDIVSMPSYNSFELCDESYKKSVLRSNREKTFSLEMASTYGWYKYSAHPYGIDTFGASASANDLIKEFKFTTKDVVKFILEFYKEV